MAVEVVRVVQAEGGSGTVVAAVEPLPVTSPPPPPPWPAPTPIHPQLVSHVGVLAAPAAATATATVTDPPPHPGNLPAYLPTSIALRQYNTPF